MTEDPLRPLGERLGRTGVAAVTIGLVTAVAAPIVAFLTAAATSGGSGLGALLGRAVGIWLVISAATIVTVTLWLWWGWESPGADTMGDEEVPS